MPQTAPGRNDEYHALPCGRDKGTRRPDRPSGVSKASESQPTESNLTSANGQDCIVADDSRPERTEIVTNETGNMAQPGTLQDRGGKAASDAPTGSCLSAQAIHGYATHDIKTHRQGDDHPRQKACDRSGAC